jgi:hypothetical protein
MAHDLPADLIQRSDHQDEVVVEFPNGLRLVKLQIGESEIDAGEMVSFRARWVTAAPLSGQLFGIRLRPADIAESDTGSASAVRWDRLAAKGRFVQGFPVVYGLRGLAASPLGTIYEQECRFIVPTNTPSGEYAVEIGYAPSYPPEYEQWTRLDSENTLTVHLRPLPTNGP